MMQSRIELKRRKSSSKILFLINKRRYHSFKKIWAPFCRAKKPSKWKSRRKLKQLRPNNSLLTLVNRPKKRHHHQKSQQRTQKSISLAAKTLSPSQSSKMQKMILIQLIQRRPNLRSASHLNQLKRPSQHRQILRKPKTLNPKQMVKLKRKSVRGKRRLLKPMIRLMP